MLSFTILTTEAHEGIQDLHTRTPVILDEQARNPGLREIPRRSQATVNIPRQSRGLYWCQPLKAAEWGR